MLACDAGGPGSIPGLDMFVSGCSSRGCMTLVKSLHNLLLCLLRYLSILPLAQSEALPVLQHLRQVEELRDELLHVAGGHVAHHTPGGGEAVEAPVSQVKVPVLEPVLRIHDILVLIPVRTRGSMPLTNGSGSCSFRH